jgi:SAM-dependent methyltransferase
MAALDVNPWLSIPASDYEAHMSSPAVGQLQYLSRVFRELLVELQPNSVAVLGCATGNGFEHIRPAMQPVIGVDINPAYLDILRSRFGDRLPGLKLLCADMERCALESRSLDLVHCALVLEYVRPVVAIENAAAWLKPEGVLSVVLQLPSEDSGPVTATPYTSLRALESTMKLVNPELVRDLALRQGLRLKRSRIDTLPTGKAFHVGVYILPGRKP